MFEEVYFKSRRIACTIVVGGIATISAAANVHAVSLGPPNPGAENALAGWYRTTIGGGSSSVDQDDPATGSNYFKIEVSNAASSRPDHADLRSEIFPLQGAGKAHEPIAVSFAYELPDKVKPGDNVVFSLQFFEQTSSRI